MASRSTKGAHSNREVLGILKEKGVDTATDFLVDLYEARPHNQVDLIKNIKRSLKRLNDKHKALIKDKSNEIKKGISGENVGK